MSFIESSVSPIPAEVALTPLIITRAHSWYYYAGVTTLASVIGGLAGYGIGALFFDLLGSPLVTFYGLEGELNTTQQLLAANTFLAIFVGAFTPLPYKLFTIAAGLLYAPLLPFLAASLVGRGIRFFAFSFIVHLWGAMVARMILRYFTVLTVLAILVILGGIVWVTL
jgi:membrane protein YqaA with SNARE-associated domain